MPLLNSTPGPWLIKVALSTHYQIEGGGIVIAMTPHYKNESSANAYLLAASPDLLEKLQAMVDAFDASNIDPIKALAAIEQAKSAINKAKGTK